MVGHNFPPWVLLQLSLLLWNRLALKTTIYTIAQAISRWGGRETENTQHGSADWEDRRGDVVGATLGCPFVSINTISFTTMMKRG
jgi:hypothetical protein